MVVNGFKRLSESYQSRDKLNNSIKEMVETLEKDFRVLDKYPVKINHDGVTISRKNKLDIISTEELNEIESETGTQLIYANDRYYMLAWNFRIAKEKGED